MSTSLFSKPVAATVEAGNYLVVLQSGEVKILDFTTLVESIEFTPATEADAGVLAIANNAAAVDKTVTNKTITPEKLYWALTHGLLDKLVFNGATGTANTGDINITGEFKVNGVAITGLSNVTSTSFTSVSSVEIPLPLVTNNLYRLILFIPTNGYLTNIDFSTNGGASYSAPAQSSIMGNGATLTGSTGLSNLSGGAGSEPSYIIDIAQLSIAGTSNVFGRGSGMSRAGQFCDFGFNMFISAAAVNKVRLTFSTTSSGLYLLTPMNKR